MESSTTSDQRPQRGRRLVLVTAVVGLMTALSTAGAIAASSLFIDVDAGDTHEDGIAFMADSGVTVGCTADEYCPGDPVTRAQMATFMHRLSGTDPDTDPSVNAATVGGLTVQEIQNGVTLPPPGDPEPTLLKAVISGAGTVTSSSGITDVDRPVDGVYTVDFDRDTSTCALTLTPSTTTGSGQTIEFGRVSDTRILVGIRDASDGSASNSAFHLVGVC